MRRLVRTIDSLTTARPVLIQGESGTGKELVARAVHATSRRHRGPFVPVDCGALPESIIESELFGHERGAFTGAVGAPGLFRMAEGGTLFLDEIGELPIAMQAKLLRALQQKEVRPVGGSGAVPVDLRVVSATHRDLAAMVETNRFRMDLFYRLNVVRIEIPPLRERLDDVPLLVQHVLDKQRRSGVVVDGVADEALARLMEHDWPGNVRELEDVISRLRSAARGCAQPICRWAEPPRVAVGDRARGCGKAGAPVLGSLPLAGRLRAQCPRARTAESVATRPTPRVASASVCFYQARQAHHAARVGRPRLMR
jgi:transcriptional regulator with PAS, ATPase and Fis domain